MTLPMLRFCAVGQFLNLLSNVILRFLQIYQRISVFLAFYNFLLKISSIEFLMFDASKSFCMIHISELIFLTTSVSSALLSVTMFNLK